MRVYAGVGSRATPDHILELMVKIAKRLSGEGWVLRSGHAPGADQAFERGADYQAEVYLPWPSFERGVQTRAKDVFIMPTSEAANIASRFHPTWWSLKQPTKDLMARNSHQVLGRDLRTPVQFLVCWTPGGRGEGGTGQAIRIADHHDVPVFDLARKHDFERLASWTGHGYVRRA